jgi:hypothetical protein
MKWFRMILIIQILIVNYGCFKNSCPDYYELDKMDLFNYNLQNVKNVKITGYTKDDNFQIAQDSFEITKFQKIDSYGYDSYVFLNKKINTNYDYDVYFIDLNKHCKITGIKIKKVVCSDGLFTKDYSHSFDEYYVDGLIFKCQVLKAAP